MNSTQILMNFFYKFIGLQDLYHYLDGKWTSAPEYSQVKALSRGPMPSGDYNSFKKIFTWLALVLIDVIRT